jgi:alcohol dehydrogenase
MTPWLFFNPVEIVAGPGRLNELLLHSKTGRNLLVTTDVFTALGLTDRVKQILKGRELGVFDRVNPNPELSALEALLEQYRDYCPDQIIAIGGGSVMDTAKVLAVFLRQDDPGALRNHVRQGKPFDPDLAIPLLVVPTTSGTGAEVTPFATIWDDVEKKKLSLDHPSAFAKTAILDAELTLELPRQLTLFTGLDALSHSLESLWNRHAGAVSRLYAVAAIQRIVTSLPGVLLQGDDLEKRTAMQEAAVLAGLAISATRTAIAHAISYPLTLHYGVPHGLAASFTLPAILRLCIRKGLNTQLEPALETKVLAMLDSLALPQEISHYASPEQILALKEEMGNPARSRNFALDLTQDELLNLLKSSCMT